MKYFLSVIWKFIKQIPKNFGKFIKFPKDTETTECITMQIAPTSIKIKRKRKSFRSFLREESQSRIKRKRLTRERRRLRKSNRSNKNGQTSSILISQQDFSESPNKDCFTNELEPPSFSLFQDNNGLEISAIISPVIRSDQFINQNNESDEELLELINGIREKPKQAIRFIRQKQGSVLQKRRFKAGKQWWQAAIEDSQILNRNIQTYSGQNRQSFQSEKRDSHIKVINLIDLVEDQNFPKSFQVPLSYC